MQPLFSNALSKAVENHIKLPDTRRETLAWLALLIMRQGTICLWRLAVYAASPAQTDSARRRFHRFFQHVKLDGAAAACVAAGLLGLGGKPWVLAVDRTNGESGKTTINILMVPVIWNGMGIPLPWTLPPKAGNSNTLERTGLLDRPRAVFPDMKIASLMGGRAFAGGAWMTYPRARKIPFIPRPRENQYVVREGYAAWTIAAIARHLNKGQKMILKGACRPGQDEQAPSPPIRLAIMRIASGELLALACSSKPHHALASYRRRWTIETMFGNLKTKGFNLEDTHLTNAGKLSTLLALLALAVALSVKTGVAAARRRPIPIKKHGRRAWPLFAPGLSALRKILAAANPPQVSAFLSQLLSPKLPLNSLKSLAH